MGRSRTPEPRTLGGMANLYPQGEAQGEMAEPFSGPCIDLLVCTENVHNNTPPGFMDIYGGRSY